MSIGSTHVFFEPPMQFEYLDLLNTFDTEFGNSVSNFMLSVHASSLFLARPNHRLMCGRTDWHFDCQPQGLFIHCLIMGRWGGGQVKFYPYKKGGRKKF